jgi:hypothetical protein
MTHQGHYITVSQAKHEVGHFDFYVGKGELQVRYGTFATSPDGESYSEWSSSCLKTLAIEVENVWRTRYRGIGSSLVSLALQWGRHKGLDRMLIIKPRTPAFWLKLRFVWQGEDLAFYFATMRTPLARITLRSGK